MTDRVTDIRSFFANKKKAKAMGAAGEAVSSNSSKVITKRKADVGTAEMVANAAGEVKRTGVNVRVAFTACRANSNLITLLLALLLLSSGGVQGDRGADP